MHKQNDDNAKRKTYTRLISLYLLLYKFSSTHFINFFFFFLKNQAAFSQQEVRRLVNFYLSNLEFACGCSLDRASSLQWDQNEDLPQFGGPHMRVPGGFGSILKHLAQGLDIKFDCQVRRSADVYPQFKYHFLHWPSVKNTDLVCENAINPLMISILLIIN